MKSIVGPKMATDKRGWRDRSLLRVLFALSLLWLLPALACGSFAPRPTPTPTAQTGFGADPSAQTAPAAGGEQDAIAAATPLPVLATETPVPEVTPTFTPTVVPGTALAAGQKARVSAPGGLNLRGTPSTAAQLVIQLGTNQVVDVVEGPTDADGFTWWRLDDGSGNVGWAAQGDGETEWISPNVGDIVQPVNRPPRVGDRVVVAIPLSLRAQPGTGAVLLTEINPGGEYTVLAGPQPANGYNWYQIRSDDGTLEGWAADGDETDRWLSPLE